MLIFGQLRYLRDTFKAIEYLVAPAAGLGYKIIATEATLFQVDAAVGGVWERDFGDSLYTFGAGLAAALTTKSTLKVELLETYKSLPPRPTIDKQDVALITSLVYAF